MVYIFLYIWVDVLRLTICFLKGKIIHVMFISVNSEIVGRINTIKFSLYVISLPTNNDIMSGIFI